MKSEGSQSKQIVVDAGGGVALMIAFNARIVPKRMQQKWLGRTLVGQLDRMRVYTRASAILHLYE